MGIIKTYNLCHNMAAQNPARNAHAPAPAANTIPV